MGVLRRVAQVLLLVATLIVGAAAAAIIVSQTAWFKDWLRALIVRQANQYLTGRLSIGRLGGNLFFGLEFEDIGVTLGGERVITVRSAGLDYSVIQFISGDLVVDHIRLDRPVVVLKKQDGAWNLGQLVRRQRREKERTGPGRAVTIGEVGISDGRFVFDRAPVLATSGTSGLEEGVAGSGGAAKEAVAIPREISRVDARFSFKYEPVRYTVDIGHLSLRGRDPDIALNALSGRIAQAGESLFLDSVAIRTAESSLTIDGEVATYASAPVLNITASADKLDVPEIARLIRPLQGIALQPAFRVVAKGPLDRAALDFSVRSSAGNVSGQVTADLLGPSRGVAGEVHLDHLDLAPIVKAPAAKSDLSGLARVDVRFPSATRKGPVSGAFSVSTFSARIGGYQAEKIEARGRVDGLRVTVNDARAMAYGAAATAAGTVEPGVRGPAGVRGLAIDLHGSVAGLDLRRLPRNLKVPALDSRLAFSYRVAGVGAELEGEARLRRSTLEGAELADETRAAFSTIGPTIGYSAEGGIENLDVRRYGRALEIDALAADRFASNLNGRFSARGSGTGLATLRLDATAALHSSTLDTIEFPLMNVEAHIADGAGRFRADGGFSNLDPARLTGRADIKGLVAGRVKADVEIARLSGPMSVDSIAASGEVALGSSTIGGLEIQKALIAGQYRERAGEIRQLAVTGPDIGVTASGPIALGSSGNTNVVYHVETPNLAAIGRLAGRKDLNGFLSLDGRVSGNGSDLRTEGDLRAGNLRMGGADVLTAESRYQVSVPDLDAARARVRAESTLGFLKVGGQEINVLRATTTYASKQVDFDATAEQAVRQARVVGALLLHPEHQEVHLNEMGFTTQGMTWDLAPGSRPTIRYGGGDVTLANVHLVSGQQSLAAEGRIGKDSNLRAAVTNVDLARVDTLIVGERRLGGTLNAAARITGPTSALNVVSDFSVDSGSFRDFRYQSLGGTVTYGRRALALDVRLQQGPQSWLTARGTLPLATFASSRDGKPVPGADAPVDVAIKSSPIDLGLVQGFTSAITKASGTLLADVRIQGTAAAPRMSGQVAVNAGAFTVEPIGVSYTDMNGRVELQPGRAVIEGFGVTDEHGERLLLSGEMGLQGRSVGALRLKVNSTKFEVMHNDVGRLTVNTALTVGGQLRAPEVTGDVGVNTGTIDLDRVLDMVGSSAYSTTPAAPAELSAGPARRGGPPVGTGGRGATNPGGAPQAPPAPEPAAGTRPAQAAAAQPAPAAAGTPFDAATLNVNVKIPDALVLTGQDIQPGNTPIAIGNVNITLGGDLRVTKRPGLPMRFVGVVNTVRGTYDFQGRRFDIQRDGRVRLTGSQPINPILDVTATRLISGVETRVQIGGTMRAPELTLTSSPPLDQADILSLIIFNQPANQLGEGEQVSLAQRAGALATGFVAGKLADSIGRALNLDVFEIQTQATSQGGQAATVTVGEQIGRNLYVKVVQAVGAENTSTFVLDYTLTDWLRFQTTVSQGATATRTLMRRPDQTGGDLIFFFSY